MNEYREKNDMQRIHQLARAKESLVLRKTGLINEYRKIDGSQQVQELKEKRKGSLADGINALTKKLKKISLQKSIQKSY